MTTRKRSNMHGTSALLLLAAIGALGPAGAQCPAESQLKNYSAGGSTACDCFIPGEQAGAVFTAPASHYPLEILKVGIAWGSHFGGSPTTLEQAIHIYNGGLPDPGAPIFTYPGPVLVDGATNVFDFEPQPGKIIAPGGPITVTIEFLNQNSGSPFAPTVRYDGDGCQPGKNAVFVQPGGWSDACPQGVPGDWVFYVEYRRANCREATHLSVAAAAGGSLQLAWTPSCQATDTDHAIYEGFVGTYSSHLRHTCSTSGGTSATIAPGSGNTYYLVVPTDGTTEGTYGKDGGGSERPQGTVVCASQSQQTCP